MDWQTLFGGLAAGVALAALVKNYFDSEARSRWESDQTTRRENFEKRQADKQLEWQHRQEEQRKRERQEDLNREIQDSTPNLRVEVALGYRTWGRSSVSTLIIKVRNMGKVAVYIDAPMIQDASKSYIHTLYEPAVTLANWPTMNFSSQAFPMILYPTQSHEVQWVRDSLIDTLRESYSGQTTFRGAVRDGTGRIYLSPDCTAVIDEETYSLTIPLPNEV